MKTKPILKHPVIYLIVYEAKRQILDILKLLYANGYEREIRLDRYNWVMYNKDDNAEYHFDRYDSVFDYEYINSLKIVGDAKDNVDKSEIERWKNMITED